jgi:hypothetical protein
LVRHMVTFSRTICYLIHMKIKTKQHSVSMWCHCSQGGNTHRNYSGVNREGASDKAVATREVLERKIGH